MNEITEAIVGDTDADAALARLRLLYAVEREIHCPYIGTLLDADKAVLVEYVDLPERRGSAVMDSRAWDAMAQIINAQFTLSGIVYTVHDGRELFGSQK
ncbi:MULTISPECIES: hypothetical protein [Streptosporangium]|uniref:Uncharacterized protein n=1 Tax=Streptosporangium brasiliense TaxID=47480 RepID=A0ABT9RQ03_9ACTN|nr:hypothetical protein [Streptosporangium brasiliense]MDP9870365.1 hypothetical protein [Streptosporangium brasiliense]